MCICCLCCCTDENAPTDVKTNAVWNFRFLYDVKLPMEDCRFYLQAWDKDVVSGDGGDLIGGAVDIDNGSDVERAPNKGFDSMNDFFAQAESRYRRYELRRAKLAAARQRRPLTADEERALNSLDALITHRPADEASVERRLHGQRGGARGGAADPARRAVGFLQLRRMHQGKKIK